MTKRKKNIISLVILVIAIISLLLINIGTIRKTVIEAKLKKAYGFDCKVTTIDKVKSIGKENEGYKFLAETDDQVEFVGLCNFWGDTLEESYVHFFYSDEGVAEVEKITDTIISDAAVFEDIKHNTDLLFGTVPSEEIKSYDEYCESTQGTNHLFKVFLKEDVDENILNNLLSAYDDAFANQNYTIMIWRVSEESYQVAKDLVTYHRGNIKVFEDTSDSEDTLLARYNNHGFTGVGEL